MRRVTRQRDRPFSRATAIRAGRFGARRKVIRAIQPTGNSIGISVSIFRWTISGRSRADSGNAPTQQTIEPATSTWGDKGHLEVWLSPSNSWIYPRLHAAARRMTEVARTHVNDATPFADRVLKQLARELLLAQSSDWAFLMKTGT